VDIRQTRPKFILIPKECGSENAAFGLTKNDPHPLETRCVLAGMRGIMTAV
jgi:hypothetical protein